MATQPGAWSKGSACCPDCGTTDRPHYSRGRCKPCYFAWYRREHLEERRAQYPKHREQQRTYYREHREERRAYDREHREERRAYHRQYRIADPERHRMRVRSWRERNHERYLAWSRRYQRVQYRRRQGEGERPIPQTTRRGSR